MGEEGNMILMEKKDTVLIDGMERKDTFEMGGGGGPYKSFYKGKQVILLREKM
jgi:hypothetical protein